MESDVRRSWIALALGAIGVVLALTPVGVLGLAAGVAAVVVGNDQRLRDRRAGRPIATATRFGIGLGAVAIFAVVALVVYVIARGIADGTFG